MIIWIYYHYDNKYELFKLYFEYINNKKYKIINHKMKLRRRESGAPIAQCTLCIAAALP